MSVFPTATRADEAEGGESGEEALAIVARSSCALNSFGALSLYGVDADT